MNHFFRQLPLPVKLMLIGFIPLAFLIYLSTQLYNERAQKVNLFGNYIDRMHQSRDITRLIDNLQTERKYSFEYTLKKTSQDELFKQRPQTDSIIKRLSDYNQTLSDFASYTFLDQLDTVRALIDRGYSQPTYVMDSYTNMVFRLNTLNTLPTGSYIYLQPVYKDLVAQKLLSEMVTYLGIMSANIYNALYTRQYMIEILFGTRGVYQVYNTYETEFLLKASPAAIGLYKNIQAKTSLHPANEYIQKIFKTFSFDSTYNHTEWDKISSVAIDELRHLQQNLLRSTEAQVNALYQNEQTEKKRTLISLIIILVLVISILAYTIRVTTSMLNKLKLAAQHISKGATPQLPFDKTPNDVIGNLAQSIFKIDENNRKLAHAADAIGNGNFSIPVEARSKEDVLGNAIIRMKDNLQQSIAGIKKAQEEMKEKNDELRSLSAHLQNIREEERINIAREMHDELGQLLTGFKMDVSWMNKNLNNHENPKISERLAGMVTIVDDAVKFVRKISSELRPSLLDDLGLIPALEWYAEEFEKRFNIGVHFDSGLNGLNISPKVATGLFRIYQESLTNIARHADAKKVTATLTIVDNQLLLIVSDDGKGFDKSPNKKTLGLLGMKERALMIGGKLEIKSEPGKGTRVLISVPVQTTGES
jgi:signal transduction histidine kinase